MSLLLDLISWVADLLPHFNDQIHATYSNDANEREWDRAELDSSKPSIE